MSVETSTLTEATIVSLSQQKGEPEWMRRLRLEALEAFLASPDPKWDRTRIDGVDWNAIKPYQEPAQKDELPPGAQELIAAAGDKSAVLVQVGSQVVHRSVPDALVQQGVVFTSLDEAVANHPDLVKEHLAQAVKADEDKLIALHSALTAGGAFVYVPKDVRVDVPLQWYIWSDEPNLGLFPHILIVADVGSEVTFVESCGSTDGVPHVASAVCEVFTKPNARVTYSSVQGWGDGAQSFTTRRARLGRDSAVHWVLGELGSGLGRAATRSFLDGDGSESTAMMVFFGDQEQHLDAGLVMTHIGDHTSSDMMTKGVLKDRARCVYRALTDIEDGARFTTAFQRENTLVLSKEARIDAIPGLEIEETEVQAGHAATVGQVDENHLFYLMSRGPSRAEAIKLIVDGFFDPVLSRIPVDGVKASLQEMIDRKMRR